SEDTGFHTVSDTGSSNAGAATDISKISCLSPKEKVNEKGKIGERTSNVQNAALHMDGDPDAHTKLNSSHSAEATVQILKKPSRAFGSLLGVSAKRKFDPLERASRVLKMERHSLEYLLNHFCGVVANKEYQNADWRIRPLPQEMI
ncbi:UNVERIFIED_CONTAM: protein RRP6-like 2, partial [Sesamum radiatum]